MPSTPGFWTLIAVVCVAHTAVLWQVSGSLPSLHQGSRAQGLSSTQVWRLVAPRARASTLGATTSESLAALGAPSVAVAADSDLANRVSNAPPSATESRVAAARTASEAVSADPGIGSADYLPRKMLTAGAAPLDELRVPFPDAISGVVNLRVIVCLFIDEQGVVQRVRVDTPNIAPAFVAAVQETFRSARFKPGEVNSVPVRSQLALEVEFFAAH